MGQETKRVELSLSSNYLAHWTTHDAFRELYQNAFDREAEDYTAKWFSTVSDSKRGKCNITLTSENTDLNRNTLLLGETSKATSSKSIGKFGEGYKLAILVFLRNGSKVTILTNSEKWEFALEYSADFGATMLVIYMSKIKELNNNLSFLISGVPRKSWHSYSQYNLRLQDNVDKVTTDKGTLLKDKRNRGKIFVGGLFVCEYTGDAMYGYDFKPGTFALGRDRRTIGGIDLTWETSKAILEATRKDIEVEAQVVKGIATESITKTEGEYVHQFVSSFNQLKSKVWSWFQKSHPETIPVASQEDFEAVKSRYVSAPSTSYVSSNLKSLLKSTDEFKSMEEELETKEPEPVLSPYDILVAFSKDYFMEEQRQLAFEEILIQSKNWEEKE